MAKIGSFQVAKRVVDQATSEAPPEPDTFEFEGQEFRIVDGVPSMLPLMAFAAAMENEDDAGLPLEALGAMYKMLRYCMHREDWARFEKAAMRAQAGPDDLLPITMAVWGAVTNRPFRDASGSPDGQSTTSTSSKGTSSSPDTGQQSTTRVDLPDSQPAAPELRLLTPANEWAGPAHRPDLNVPMVSIDDYARGRTA